MRIILLVIAWICVVLGFIGIVLPVLPTTPFLLLAIFLFTKSSPQAEAWLKSTKAYAKYVIPFKSSGGLPATTKVRILAVSYLALSFSAYMVQKKPVWIMLACAAVFLFYLMFVRIPTISAQKANQAALEAEREFNEGKPKNASLSDNSLDTLSEG